jgi:rsbT co-antagonist protein RsbR
MGAQCIISGIRPQIAQTMVHLGVGFEGVVTAGSISDALQRAFRMLDLTVTTSDMS